MGHRFLRHRSFFSNFPTAMDAATNDVCRKKLDKNRGGDTTDTGPALFSLAAWRRRLFFAVCVAPSFGLLASGALAAVVVSVGDGNNIPGGATAADTTWTLAGDAIINNQINLPTAMVVNSPLTIEAEGEASKITITLPVNEHAFYSNSGAVWINTDGNVTFKRDAGAAQDPNNGSLIDAQGHIYLGTNSESGKIAVQDMETAMTKSSEAYGGAIYSADGNIYIGNESSIVDLSNNTTGNVAAAVYTRERDDNADDAGGSVTIRGSSITINNNHADMHSGAIYTSNYPHRETGDGNIYIGNENGSTTTVEVIGNSAGGSGGAIQSASNEVTINAQSITLRGNQVTGWEGTTSGAGSGSGGAVLGSRAVTIGNASSTVTIEDNTAVGKGGAIYTSNKEVGNVIINGSTIMLSGNEAGTVNTDPSGSGPSYSSGYLGGGAIYANKDITINGGSITIRDNLAAQGNGGALEADGNITISGQMLVENNTALNPNDYGVAPGGGTWKSGYGGAIWAGHDVTLNATSGNMAFYGNKAAGDGGAIRVGGNLTLNATAGNIEFDGNEANSGNLTDGKGNAIWFQNSYQSTPSNATATFNATSGQTITFKDSIENNTTYGLLTVSKQGDGAVIFDGVNASSPIYGTTVVEEGAFVVRNNASYGDSTTGTSFTVAPGATLAGGGTSAALAKGTVVADQFTLQGKLDISGKSVLSSSLVGNASGGYSTFTIDAHNQVFAAGSQIYFNTYLNDGDQQLTDKLILKGGSSSGQATLQVQNTGGLGALTVNDGIMLVENQNTSSSEQFTLGSRVAAGAYEYNLFQGGSAGPNHWYLRSEVTDNPPTDPPPTPPTVPPAPPTSITPASPTPHPANPASPPAYRAEVPVDSIIPALASRLGLGTLGTWHERRNGEFATNYTTPDGYKRAGWGRIFGETGSYGDGFTGSLTDRVNAFEDHGSSYDFRYGGVQAGIDIRRKEEDNGHKEDNRGDEKKGYGTRDIPGLYFGAGLAQADVDALIDYGFGTEAGEVKMEGYSLGAYHTHIGKSGWYLDPVLQLTYYSNIEATSKISESQTFKTDGWGLLASLEGGYPIALKHDYTFEPQAQLIYQYLDIDSDADAFGRIEFSDGQALYGRLAGRLSKDWTRDDGRKSTAWGRVGLWTDFGAQGKTTFSNLQGANKTTVPVDLGGSWAQFNLGYSRQLRQNISFFVVGDYSKTVSDPDGQAWGGRFGLSVEWGGDDEDSTKKTQL